MRTYTYEAMVKLPSGGVTTTQVTATNVVRARQVFEAQYGKNCLASGIRQL